MSVDEIMEELEPDGGWWKASTGEAVEEAVRDMVKLGVDGESICAILSNVIHALKGEYGD